MKEPAFPSAIRLIEDALVLTKRADPLAWLIYLAGIVPFFGLLLFETTDLVQNPFAVERLMPVAFILALLYVWLHVCQSVFCARVYDTLTQQENALKTQVGSAVVCQSVLAGSKLVLWPITLILLVPHPVVTMFYQHSLLATDESRARGWRATIVESRKDAVYRQTQSICLLITVLLLRAILWINLFFLLFVLPSLWKTFTGIEGNVTRSPQILINATSLVAAQHPCVCGARSCCKSRVRTEAICAAI